MSATTWALDSVGSAWEIGPGPNEKMEMVSPRYTIQTHSITTSSGHVSTAQPINLQRPLNQGTKKIRSGLSFSPPSLVKTNQSLRLSEASSTCLSPSSSLSVLSVSSGFVDSACMLGLCSLVHTRFWAVLFSHGG